MAATPGLEFKLDPQSSWTPELFASLRSTGRVRVLDLKSVYKDSPVDQPFDAAALPAGCGSWRSRRGEHRYIEDPDAGPTTASRALAGAEDLFSWDAPIHSVADIEGLAQRPGAINIKPSRFGSLRPAARGHRVLRGRGHPHVRRRAVRAGTGPRPDPGAWRRSSTRTRPTTWRPADYNQGDPRPGLPASPARAPEPGAARLRLSARVRLPGA